MKALSMTARLRTWAIVAAATVGTLAISATASAANILGDQIFGVLAHAGLTGFNNWNTTFDPTPTPATVVDPGIELQIPPGNGNFGFALASADFTADTISLQIGNPSDNGDSFVNHFDMYFTDLNYGGPITNIELLSSNLPGSPTFSFGDDTFQAQLPTGGFIPAHTIYTATFQVTSAVPEPTALTLLPLAAAAILRRRKAK